MKNESITAVSAIATLEGGNQVSLSDGEVNHVLYGLTRLETTSLGSHMNVAKVETCDGLLLWCKEPVSS